MHDPSLLFILLVEEVFISLVLSIKSMVSISGRLSPHHFEMFAISPQQACAFRCWFSNDSVIAFLKGCFPSSFVAEVGISSPLCYSNDLSSILLPEALWCCSLHPSPRFVKIMFLFVLIHLTRVLCSHSSSFHLIKFCLPSQPACCLKSFLPLVPFFQ